MSCHNFVCIPCGQNPSHIFSSSQPPTEPCPRAMFGSSCNVTQSRLPSDVECRGKVLSCEDWPFDRAGGLKSQGGLARSFIRVVPVGLVVVDSSTCFLSVHIREPSTDQTSAMKAPTDDHIWPFERMSGKRTWVTFWYFLFGFLFFKLGFLGYSGGYSRRLPSGRLYRGRCMLPPRE